MAAFVFLQEPGELHGIGYELLQAVIVQHIGGESAEASVHEQMQEDRAVAGIVDLVDFAVVERHRCLVAHVVDYPGVAGPRREAKVQDLLYLICLHKYKVIYLPDIYPDKQ